MTKTSALPRRSAYEGPFLVDPDQLRAIGVDPDPYLKGGSHKGGGWAGWMLDRKKDAALIERLQSITAQHGTVQ